MKLLLFSRRGVVHAADELRRTFAAIARYGFDFVVNKEFAETIPVSYTHLTLPTRAIV